MYNVIYNFAKNHNLVPIENFTLKFISAYILLDKNGNFIGFEVKDKKDKEKTMCPDIGTLANGKYNCNPIVEKVSYILDKNNLKHIGFISIMQDGAKTNENIKIVYDFLVELEENVTLQNKILQEIEFLKIKNNDFISFKIEEMALEQNDSWFNWFQEYIKNTKNNKNNIEKTISLVTGELVTPLSVKSPIIKQPSSIVGPGVFITSFSNKSFKSYGLEDNRNSPIGEDEAKIIRAGFEYLLSNENHYDKDFHIIHFCDKYNESNILEELLTPFDDLYNDEEDFELDNVKTKDNIEDEILKKILKSPQSGENVSNNLNDTFHIMSFEVTTQGRFCVSKYEKKPCEDIQKNINIWKKDTELVITSKIDNNFIKTIRPIGKLYKIFYHLMEAKNVRINEKNKQINIEFGVDKLNLLYSILNNTQIPIKYLRKAVLDTKRTIISKNNLDIVSLQIIKVYLIRKQREKGVNVSIMPTLNHNEENIAYNCGRLFAIYEIIQQTSQGKNLNTSITDNYFPSAQSNPHLIFGRLAKLSNYHLNKLEDNVKIYWCKKLQEVSSNIPYFPKTLNIEDQGMFALGYYHQKNDNYMSKKDKGENQL